jgi:hypothetical protein
MIEIDVKMLMEKSKRLCKVCDILKIYHIKFGLGTGAASRLRL